MRNIVTIFLSLLRFCYAIMQGIRKPLKNITEIT